MPDVVSSVLSVSLHRKLSIKVPWLLVNHVGTVILGQKLLLVSILKYSLIILFSFIFKRSMLKSPAKITSLLFFFKIYKNKSKFINKLIIKFQIFFWWSINITNVQWSFPS